MHDPPIHTESDTRASLHQDVDRANIGLAIIVDMLDGVASVTSFEQLTRHE